MVETIGYDLGQGYLLQHCPLPKAFGINRGEVDFN